MGSRGDTFVAARLSLISGKKNDIMKSPIYTRALTGSALRLVNETFCAETIFRNSLESESAREFKPEKRGEKYNVAGRKNKKKRARISDESSSPVARVSCVFPLGVHRAFLRFVVFAVNSLECIRT